MHTCERSARVLIISIWWWCMNAYVHHPLLAHLVHLVYYWEPWFLSFSLFGKSRLISHPLTLNELVENLEISYSRISPLKDIGIIHTC
nr:hypothetical protein CFP56_45306 [Quercus suber]